MAEVDSFLAGQSITSRAFYRGCRAIVHAVSLLLFRVKVVGAHNIPRNGAFVVAPIHRSNIDIPLVGLITKRRLRFMGKDSLWKKKPAALLLSALGGFPVTRGSADREALKRCIQVLEAGEPLVLFPEGTRKSGSQVQPLMDGSAYIAVKAGVPIIPVGIGGSEGVMPKGAKFLRPKKCVLVVGEPITVELDAEGRVPRAAVKDVTVRLSGELQRLFDNARLRAGMSE
jgi:1-acyl-sn-glycerol-3-phosphate acyltransferase